MLCLAAACSGCATSNKMFAWMRPARTEADREQLKRDAASRDLDHPELVHLKYAGWRENVGDLADARKSYNYVLQQDPKSVEAVLGLARIDQATGRMAEAEQGFRKALEMKPTYPAALNGYGQYHAANKNWTQAVPLLQAAWSEAPGNNNFRHHLATALARAGREQEALPHFTACVGEAAAHYNIGFVLYEQDRKAEAEREFNTALKLKPSLKEAERMLADLRGPREKAERTRVALANRTPAPATPAAQPRPQVMPKISPGPEAVVRAPVTRRTSQPTEWQSPIRQASHERRHQPDAYPADYPEAQAPVTQVPHEEPPSWSARTRRRVAAEQPQPKPWRNHGQPSNQETYQSETVEDYENYLPPYPGRG